MTPAEKLTDDLRGTWRTDYGEACCPNHDDENPSLTIRNGDKVAVVVHCQANCPQDAVVAAIKRLGVWPNSERTSKVTTVPANGDEEPNDTFSLALRILYSAKRTKSTDHRRYLQARGIELTPSTLMTLSANDSVRLTGRDFPAMVAPIWDGELLTGCHATWLQRDYSAKVASKRPRKMYGAAKGRYVQLSEIDPARPLVVAEGLETALSAMTLSGLPGVAALSDGGVEAFRPPRCAEVIVAADNDESGAGQKAAAALAQRLARTGVKVRIALPPTVGKDWNDIHARRGTERARKTWERVLSEADPVTVTVEGDDSGLIMERASDVEQRPVAWIWPNRIARGKITLVGGDPGLGKSMITVDIAARITTGRRWPDAGTAPQGSVVILSAEDASNDVLCPRLELAEGDLTRVQLLYAAVGDKGVRRSFSLQTDLDRLAKAVTRLGDVRLIVVDPVTAYLGTLDSHRTGDVRGLMEPLDRFARDTDVAILAITHPPKAAQSKAINAFTGSLAFVAAARMAFVVLHEPNTARSLLLPVKSNLGPPTEGLAYSIEGGVTQGGVGAARVIWDKEPVVCTVEEAMQAAGTSKRGGKLEEATRFLRSMLGAGPMEATVLKQKAEAEGITRDTLNRAKDVLGIEPEKDKKFQGKWTWGLP